MAVGRATLLVYLDTDGLLDLVTAKDERDRSDSELVMKGLFDGILTFATSQMTIVEALVHAVRARETLLRRFLTPSALVDVIPIGLDIIEDALALRARENMKTPDAIHVATGLLRGCSFYLSKDKHWRRIGLPILTVSELADKIRTQ